MCMWVWVCVNWVTTKHTFFAWSKYLRASALCHTLPGCWTTFPALASLSFRICPAPYCEIHFFHSYTLTMSPLFIHSFFHSMNVQQILIHGQMLGFYRQVAPWPHSHPFLPQKQRPYAKACIPVCGVNSCSSSLLPILSQSKLFSNPASSSVIWMYSFQPNFCSIVSVCC